MVKLVWKKKAVCHFISSVWGTSFKDFSKAFNFLKQNDVFNHTKYLWGLMMGNEKEFKTNMIVMGLSVSFKC